MFPTVEAVVMAIITMEDSTTTMGDSTTTTEDSTIIMEDLTTTMVAFTTTTMEDSAMGVRVREVDASVSTASHSVTGMGMCTVPARGETVVGEPGAIQPAGTIGRVRTSRLRRSSATIPGRTQPVEVVEMLVVDVLIAQCTLCRFM